MLTRIKGGRIVDPATGRDQIDDIRSATNASSIRRTAAFAPTTPTTPVAKSLWLVESTSIRTSQDSM